MTGRQARIFDDVGAVDIAARDLGRLNPASVFASDAQRSRATADSLTCRTGRRETVDQPLHGGLSGLVPATRLGVYRWTS